MRSAFARGLLSSLAAFLVAFAAHSLLAAPAPDGGSGSGSGSARGTAAGSGSGTAPGSGSAAGSGSGKAAVEEPDFLALQRKKLEAKLTKLRALLESVGKLTASKLDAPAALGKYLGVDLDSPDAVTDKLPALKTRLAALTLRVKESSERLLLLEQALSEPIKKLAALRAALAAQQKAAAAAAAAAKKKKPPKRRRRRRPPRRRRGARKPPAPKKIVIPAELVERAASADKRLAVVRLEHEVRAAELQLLSASIRYLEASQPTRKAAKEARDAKAAAERQAAETAKREALAAQKNAEFAREQALAELRRARTAAVRLIAGERARLEGIRAEQAKLGQVVGTELGQLAKLREELDKLRSEITARAKSLKPKWPKTAKAYDKLYDKIVDKLTELRPRAVDDIMMAFKGVPAPPAPDGVASEVSGIDTLATRVKKLQALAARLDKAAAKLKEQRQKLVRDRLKLLHEAVTWLNVKRTELYSLVTPDKRTSLSGINRTTFAQAGRELLQALFDALYLGYQRVRQIVRVPGMIVDVFTVGSTLLTVLKLIALLLLFRYLRRNWEGWLSSAVPVIGRSISLGRYAVILAKVVDTLRHAGQPLLVLIFASVIFAVLGGDKAATELRFAYDIFFWIAVYRFQLRVVQSIAKFTGMEKALRAAEGEELFEEDEDLEGPPVPRAVRMAQQLKDKSAERVDPPSVLLVRSVRAATRYILVVVLVLELTALAVGRGTIYHLTTSFSWWAALPFVYYFLKLWRPHIAAAYQALTKGKEEGALGRLVRQSEGRFYNVFIIGAAFGVVFGDRAAKFARRYLFSLDATKRLLAFLFRRRVAKQAQQLGRVVAKRADLPERLLRVFPEKALEPRDSPMAPPVLEEIKKIHGIWKDVKADGSLAVVGRAGMGKTTVLRLLERELETPVMHTEVRTKITKPAKVISWISDVFGFNPKPSSEKELVRLIREDTRPVIAVDNCHNLFLRQVGGFDGWEAFVRIVNETCDNILWVLVFNQAAWDYLYNASGRVQYFRRVLTIKPWSEELIQRLIMTRMRRARMRVSFSDLIVTQVQDINLNEQMGRTSQGYFRLLWDFTDGNPKLAGHFWLDSLVPSEEDKREVKVHLFAEPSLSELEKLPDDIAFVLTTVCEHENLSPAEAARTTNLSLDFCNFAFRYCLETGYFAPVKGSAHGRVRLSTRWQRPVMRYLKRKHMLHS
ncbi:MAG: AAA family ATPase [Myxococcales bacterium]|nr:AAA family ATPase [Myxococcales bacterium]